MLEKLQNFMFKIFGKLKNMLLFVPIAAHPSKITIKTG